MNGKLSGNVVDLNFEYRARCAECGNNGFHLVVDSPGKDWENIIGTVCTKCKHLVDWIRVYKDDK